MKLGSFFKKLDRKPEGCASRAVTLKTKHPEWLQAAIRDAHRGTLPNDWIYEECQAACDAIDEGSLTDDDSLHEHSDGRVDVYTQARFEWQAQFCLTETYSEAEAEASELWAEDSAMEAKVGTIQYCAIQYIAHVILQAWEENQETDEETVTP